MEVDVLQIRLLGPIAAYSSDGPIPLGGSKPRTILAALVLERGRVVPAGRLVDVVWPDHPPESARSLIQTYVSTLRKSFARFGFPNIIGTHPPGYLARLDGATVDADVFTELVAEADDRAQAGEHGRAAELLRTAVALCHGPALSGLETSSPLSSEARRLDELLLFAHGERFEAELNLGRLDHFAQLSGLVSRYPANERLRGQLMLTLYRLGRQADALACYREGREALVDELGVEPGRQLQQLHEAILRGDRGSLEIKAPEQNETSQSVVPAQIPPAPSDFTGRGRECECLGTALRKDSPGVHIVTGQGGSGKSALAGWVAQQVVESYPDGQLYADLRGMTDTPATPDEVLGGFLRSLGVSVGQLPESTQERTELFRSLLAGRRMLILLDDAVNELQVRQLLPGGSRCAVLITSRNRLAGLAGATLTELDVLTDEEAGKLLARIVGEKRVRGDSESARRILTACDNLPLAIRVAGARLVTRRHLPLDVFAERLTNERQRLDELSVGDLAVRSSIGLSYDALDKPAQAAVRRMGFFGIPEFNAWVVGWLLATPHTAAERLLELLVDAQLVTFTGVDQTGFLRYRLHDLVRIYAHERAEAEEPPDVLRDSVTNAIGGWRALVDRVSTASPTAEIFWRKPPEHDFDLPDELIRRVLANPNGWFRQEEPIIAVGVERAAAIGLHQLVCDFVSARMMAPELEGADRFTFRARIVDAALDAARRAGDVQSEAVMLAELAKLRYAEDRQSEALQHYGDALTKFRALHDVRGQAVALAGLGIACRESSHLAESLHFLNQAATLLQALDDAAGIGYVHRLRGSVLLEQGNYATARSDFELSLQAYERAGSRRGVAYTLRSLGIYHRGQGEYDVALRACAESAEIFGELGDELMRSYAVRAHATTQLRMGLAGQALERLEWALAVARDSGDRWGQAAALRVLGQLHLSEARLDLAESCLEAAMSLWDTIQAPLWRGRTEYDLSVVHRHRGNLDAAEEAGTNACRVFREQGSAEYAKLCCPATTADATAIQ